MTDGYCIPLDWVLAGASRHNPRCCPTQDKLGDLGQLPGGIRAHLDAAVGGGENPVKADRAAGGLR
jgi:hypothetical protein